MMFEVREERPNRTKKVVAHKLCCVVVVERKSSLSGCVSILIFATGVMCTICHHGRKIEGYTMTVKNNLMYD